MAQQHHQQQEQEQQQSNHLFILDSLYCEEEKWEAEEGDDIDYGVDDDDDYYDNLNCGDINGTKSTDPSSLHPLLLLEQDLFWEDEELVSLFSKEQSSHSLFNGANLDGSLAMARREAVEWMLRVIGHYGFSAVTAVLGVNYLDRFLASFKLQKDKPWMSQLVAVACLSLAAKVEETHVPLLLDLQVGETKFVFEAKTIQRMELLVLSTLHWKMNPVTPLSFLHHIIRRLGLKNHLHWEFLRRCERLLLSVITDPKFGFYVPSVLATAAMLHVINEIEPYNPLEYQNQLMGVLKISKDKVDECYEHLKILSLAGNGHAQSHKRKFCSMPDSPNGVIDVTFSSDSSNDSWAINSRPEPVVFKKSRAQDQQMRLPSFNRVFVDVLTSPR